MKTWLFLGDSITDADRLFTSDGLGHGYVKKISQTLSGQEPCLRLVNCGVDGFTVSRVLENAAALCHRYHPQILTLLIGINDVGLMMNTNRTPIQQQAQIQKFRENYEQLLHILTYSHPEALCVMEPFLFPWPLEYKNWFPFVEQMSQIIQELAVQYEIPFLPLQTPLHALALEEGLGQVTPDGIHLTDKGHEFLANLLIQKIHDCCPELLQQL